eukprot:Hpha_TRINITY_DN9232_c0_g2::TRINITY_DN9232_c0_g2_i1::g.28793::m.28793/K15377/SLC44A2_4_5; solute carrier family 44 (choline transporter-like protein), member 2/4/5
MGKGTTDAYYQREEYTKLDAGSKYERDDNWQGFEPNRSCTDSICGVIFLGCMVGMIAVSATAFAQGDLKVITDPANDNSKINDDFAKLSHNRWVIVVCGVCTGIAGFIWLELLKRCTKVFVWSSFIAAFVLTLGAGAVVWAEAEKDGAVSPTGLKITAGVIWLLAVVVMIGLFFMRKKIDFSAEVIQQGCRGLQHNFMLIIVALPLLLVLTLGYLLWWVLTLVYVFSIKGDSIDCANFDSQLLCVENGCDWAGSGNSTCSGDAWETQNAFRWTTIYLVFMFFWVTCFLAGAGRFVIATGISRWYWDRERDNRSLGVGPALTGMGWAFGKQLGTIAMGAFILATIKTITWLLEQAKKDERSKPMKCILTCITCCCRCIESLAEYVTRFAFICSAMHGNNFFSSCKEVSHLFKRQGGQVFITDVIAHVVVNMGMVAAVSLASLGGILYMHNHHGVSASSVIILIAVCAAIFLIIGLAVQVAADTVIVCYLEDLERNSESRDFRGPDEIMMTLQGAAERRSIHAPTQKMRDYGEGEKPRGNTTAAPPPPAPVVE